MCDFCFLMVDMVWDIRKCGTLDIGNGRLGLDVDNGIDFFGSLLVLVLRFFRL